MTLLVSRPLLLSLGLLYNSRFAGTRRFRRLFTAWPRLRLLRFSLHNNFC